MYKETSMNKWWVWCFSRSLSQWPQLSVKGLPPTGVCLTPKQHPRLREESGHLILTAGGHVSHHRWPGLDRHSQMKTTPVTRVFCLCGQVWWNQSAGSLIKRPIYTDLDEEANLFWATEALFMSVFLSTGHIQSLKVLLSGIGLGYGGQLSEFRLLLVLGQNWPVGVNVIHRYKECNCFNLGPERSEKQQQINCSYKKVSKSWWKKTYLQKD